MMPNGSNLDPVVALSGQLRRISVDDYHRMIDADVFDEDDHLELLEGVLVEMSPQKPPHATTIGRLTGALVRGAGERYEVRIQLPLTLGQRSEPEPDIAVVPVGAATFDEHPHTALLIVEVARGSLKKDREIKSRLYARAGIPEYWIVNVPKRCVVVMRDPDVRAGAYRRIATLKGKATLKPGPLPGPTLTAESLFRK